MSGTINTKNLGRWIGQNVNTAKNVNFGIFVWGERIILGILKRIYKTSVHMKWFILIKTNYEKIL